MIAAPAAVELDHLVVACASLDAGRAWCEAVLGATPSPGGAHPRMGTHNLLLSIASSRFPRSYLELIAIDPGAPAPATPRWFELDRAGLQAQIATTPRLVQWVARTSDIEAAASTLSAAGFDPGAIVAAERTTARGTLRWRIAIATGGVRHAEGAVPLLIEWGDVHPADSLPASGVALEAMTLGGAGAAVAARLGIAPAFVVDAAVDAAPLVVLLATPRGRVRLSGA